MANFVVNFCKLKYHLGKKKNIITKLQKVAEVIWSLKQQCIGMLVYYEALRLKGKWICVNTAWSRITWLNIPYLLLCFRNSVKLFNILDAALPKTEEEEERPSRPEMATVTMSKHVPVRVCSTSHGQPSVVSLTGQSSKCNTEKVS